jgi:hypothetical protein
MTIPETAIMATPIGIETPNAIFPGVDRPDDELLDSVLFGFGAEVLVDDELADNCESGEVIGTVTVPAIGEN